MMEEAGKLPLKRLEVPINKFIKVAIPTDLERLHQHQTNIEKYQRSGQWERLHQEQINASRTVQQLRANIREMEKLCSRVRKEDGEALERMVRPTKERASAAARDFLSLHAESVMHPSVGPGGPEDMPGNQEDSHEKVTPGEMFYAGEVQVQCFLPNIPEDQNASESWETLQEDLLLLNGLVNEFSEVVHSQQEMIDRIEDNVTTAAANVEEGTRSLGKAVKYKAAVLPVMGAVLGSVVGGPLGLLAGFKVAGVVAAVSGGVLGFAGGRQIQKSRRARVDEQLEQLSSPGDQHCAEKCGGEEGGA